MPPEADEYYESFDLHVRFTEGQDLVVRVSPEDSVAAIKEKIKQTEAERTRNKNIRLIYSARILDDSRQLRDYGMGKLTVSDSKAKMPPPPPVYVHCSLSDYQPHSQTNDRPQITPRTGFDRLRDSGFTEEEIQSLRERFHRWHGTDDDPEQIRRREEQWMDAVGEGETLPDGTPQGTYKEMVWGLVLGFFLGIICLFWFRESVFTRRHQMGIVAGILINISFGVLHVYY